MTAFRRVLLAGVTVLAAVVWSAGPVAAGGSHWKVGYITPSGKTLSFASADRTDAGIAAFNFTDQPNTSLLVTTHGSSPLLGDQTGKTITATFDITGATGFFYDTTGNPCGTPANTRLYFQTDNGGGFAFTHFWWSNPESQVLANGHWTLTASVEPAEWSDWNGQNGATQVAGFLDAASNVKMIGLSFGGGCFFENGVGTTDGSGTFTLDSYSAS
jgi:hypothetical protein